MAIEDGTSSPDASFTEPGAFGEEDKVGGRDGANCISRSPGRKPMLVYRSASTLHWQCKFQQEARRITLGLRLKDTKNRTLWKGVRRQGRT